MGPFAPNLQEITKLMIASMGQTSLITPFAFPAAVELHAPVQLIELSTDPVVPQSIQSEVKGVPTLKILGVILLVAGIAYLIKTLSDRAKLELERKG